MAVDITPKIPQGKKIIEAYGYGDGSFKVSKEKFSGSIIIFPDAVINWNISSFSELDINSLKPVIAKKDDVELLIIGTGKGFQFLNKELAFGLKKHGITVDTMDTGAACRTYNILLAEERRVAAALIRL